MRNILWAEATNTATYLSNITPHHSNHNQTSSDELFYGTPPNAFEYLFPFVQIGYVANRNVTRKFQRCAIKCFMVGYKEHAERDTYCLYNPITRKIIESRDVVWAKWHGLPPHKPDYNLTQFKPKHGLSDEDIKDIEFLMDDIVLPLSPTATSAPPPQ